MSESEPVISATRVAPKKVRLACRRCRSRRIKCDGKTPACSNCAKAGVACLDVDSQNSHLLIPRNFASAARDRIQWLEDIIRTRLPDVDLAAGPQIDGGAENQSCPTLVEHEADEPAGTTVVPSPDASIQRRQALKRPTEIAGSPNSSDLFSEKAHTVAMNLGLVSLNSDSSQMAYLGSSSGRLFADLVGASPSSDPSSTAATHNTVDESANDLLLDRQFSLQSRYRSLQYMLRQEMPKYEDGVLLLQTYVRWIYPDYPVLDPSSLYGALAALYNSSLYDLNDEPLLPNGWPSTLEPFQWNGQVVQPGLHNGECPPMPVLAFIMFMVFNVSAMIKVRSRVYEYSPERYYRLATRFSADCFSQVSLASIQALTLHIVHCLHTPAEASVWTLVHVGMAHCVELGLHREPLAGSSDVPAVQQVKRVVFYTLYGLDRSISSIQGRPIGFRDDCFDVKLPGNTISQGNDYVLHDSSSSVLEDLGYAVSRFELDQIVSEIKTRFYLLPVRDPETSTNDSAASRDDILQKLTRWHDKFTAGSLGNHGSPDGRQKYLRKLKLQIRYHTTMILLFQPSQQIPRPSQESLQTVYDSASVILRDYELLHRNHGLHHGWKSVQNIFAAGAALVYTVWTSDLVQSRASPAELSRNLRSCSSLLSVGGEWWPSVKTSLANFGSVVDLTIQKLYTQGPAAKQARLATSTSASHGALREGAEANHDVSRPAAREADTTSYPAAWTQYSHTQQAADPETTTPGDRHAYHEARGMDQTTMQPPLQHRGDGHGYPLTAADVPAHEELMPEIEYFLADFGRSDFSWSFPLGDVEEPLDSDAFMNL